MSGEFANLGPLGHVLVEGVEEDLVGLAGVGALDRRALLARAVHPAREVVGRLDAVAHRLHEQLAHLVGTEVERDVGHGQYGLELEEVIAAALGHVAQRVVEVAQVVLDHLGDGRVDLLLPEGVVGGHLARARRVRAEDEALELGHQRSDQLVLLAELGEVVLALGLDVLEELLALEERAVRVRHRYAIQVDALDLGEKDLNVLGVLLDLVHHRLQFRDVLWC